MEALLPQVRTILSTTPARWQTLCDTLPADVLTRPPALEEWSALECLQHLVDTERMVFPARVQAFLDGREFPAFNPDSQGGRPDANRSPSDLANEFARLRSDSLLLLARLTDADLPRTARHGELGPVTLEEMLHEWAAHDLMHTVQAERALMQPFIAGSGPWRRYFADHDLGLPKRG